MSARSGANMHREYDPKAYWETRLKDGPALNTVGYLGLGLAYNKWLYRIRKQVLERALCRFPIVSEITSLLEVAPGSAQIARDNSCNQAGKRKLRRESGRKPHAQR